MQIKECRGPCRQIKETFEFSRNRNQPDGRQVWCKECAKAYNHKWMAENREAILARRARERGAKKKLMGQKIIGVYQITCVATGDRYIGSTGDIGRRWRDHLSQINAETHTNPGMAYLASVYPPWDFHMEIIAETRTLEEARELERQMISDEKATVLNDRI